MRSSTLGVTADVLRYDVQNMVPTHLPQLVARGITIALRSVNCSIDVHDQRRLATDEVSHERVDGLLPPDLDAHPPYLAGSHLITSPVV